MPIKIFGQSTTATDNGVASAIDFAWQNGADVISNSWNYQGVDFPNYVPAITNAVNRARTQGRGNLGCVIVFSASNTATRSYNGYQGVVSYPANLILDGILTGNP